MPIQLKNISLAAPKVGHPEVLYLCMAEAGHDVEGIAK